jgi:hypothetical protein
MKTQDLVLIPATTHGTPSGNYDGSSLDFDGERQKAADYYISRSGTQSVLFDVDDFVGDVIIQGTLDADPQVDGQWFDIYEFPDDSSATTATISHTIKGNFTWLRARVTNFTSGVINSVTLTY